MVDYYNQNLTVVQIIKFGDMEREKNLNVSTAMQLLDEDPQNLSLIKSIQITREIYAELDMSDILADIDREYVTWKIEKHSAIARALLK